MNLSDNKTDYKIKQEKVSGEVKFSRKCSAVILRQIHWLLLCLLAFYVVILHQLVCINGEKGMAAFSRGVCPVHGSHNFKVRGFKTYATTN